MEGECKQKKTKILITMVSFHEHAECSHCFIKKVVRPSAARHSLHHFTMASSIFIFLSLNKYMKRIQVHWKIPTTPSQPLTTTTTPSPPLTTTSSSSSSIYIETDFDLFTLIDCSCGRPWCLLITLCNVIWEYSIYLGR